MRNRSIGDTFNLFDFIYSHIGLPLKIAKEGIIIATHVLRGIELSNDFIKGPSKSIGRNSGKGNDSSSILIYYEHNPVSF